MNRTTSEHKAGNVKIPDTKILREEFLQIKIFEVFTVNIFQLLKYKMKYVEILRYYNLGP